MTIFPTRPDVRIVSHGSIVLLYPDTDPAKEWVQTHINLEAQWWGNAVVVEPRYIEAIVAGMTDDGLLVE